MRPSLLLGLLTHRLFSGDTVLAFSSTSTMLLRVRSNIGTWKYTMSPAQTIKDVLDRIQNQNSHLETQSGVLSSSPATTKFEALVLSQALSRDPAGREPLAVHKSLQDLGIVHGAMIYCRVQRDMDENQKPSFQPSSKRHHESRSAKSENSKRRSPTEELSPDSRPIIDLLGTNSQTVIDLIDSSDDENEEGLSPPRKKRTPIETGSASKRNPSSGKVHAVASVSESMKYSPPPNFQIASYNVWFGPPDPSANQVHPQQRMAAIANELQKCGNSHDLLFIGFQELTDSLRHYLEPHLQKMDYKFCTQPGLAGSYGVGLAVSKHLKVLDSKFLPFSDSQQGRGLLYVQTPNILFGTTHLESFIDAKSYNGAVQREAQIVQAASFFQDRLKESPSLQIAIITGDFNWDDERKRGESPNVSLLNLLRQQGCNGWNDPGTPFDYTYDGKENPMLSGNLRRRFDRCIYLIRGQESKSSVDQESYQISLRKIGMNAIPNLSWNKKNFYNGTSRMVPVAPSDHFGIAIRFLNK